MRGAHAYMPLSEAVLLALSGHWVDTGHLLVIRVWPCSLICFQYGIINNVEVAGGPPVLSFAFQRLSPGHLNPAGILCPMSPLPLSLLRCYITLLHYFSICLRPDVLPPYYINASQ